MTCGIYLLRFKGTTKVYIGQSVRLEYRYKEHLKSMVEDRAAKKLQQAFQMFGAPTFEILTECIEDLLDTYEKETIEIYDSVINGFNTLSIPGGLPDNTGINNGRSVYTEEQILSVFELLLENRDMEYKDISIITEVTEGVVRGVSSGVSHTWIQDRFPDKYRLLMSLVGSRRYRSNKGNSAKAQGKTYPPIVSPIGEVITDIDNVTQFAKSRGLHPGNFCQMLNGNPSFRTVKGWKLLESGTGVEPV